MDLSSYRVDELQEMLHHGETRLAADDRVVVEQELRARGFDVAYGRDDDEVVRLTVPEQLWDRFLRAHVDD